MAWFNLKQQSERVSFAEAVIQGLGQQQGLFFPENIPTLELDDAFWALSFKERATKVMQAWLGEELGDDVVAGLVERAFNFDLPLIKVNENQHCLELFHGPTLAFKDFGARFLAQCLSLLAGDKKMTILTATSGDTGAAVAGAFAGLDNIKVVVLYPDGGISSLQEKLFCTQGGNIHTLAVNGSFDDCQALVKAAFSDPELKAEYGLTSANSINVARLIAQINYYFEALAQLPEQDRSRAVFSIPSGNFGNLTAGMLAKAMGAPMKGFIAATNSNDTVPRYLGSGKWEPRDVIPTLSNAMDVTSPNNWPRVEALCELKGWSAETLVSLAVSEEQTQQQMKALNQEGYLSEPHAAVASFGLCQHLASEDLGVFLGTAHPAKFQDGVQEVLGIELPLPSALAEVKDKPVLSSKLEPTLKELADYLKAKL